MRVAAIVVLSLLGLGFISLGLRPQPQTSVAQNPGSTQASPSTGSPAPNAPAQAKPSAAGPRKKKTKTPSNCSDSTTAQTTAAGQPADAAKSTDPGSTPASAGPDASNNAVPNAGVTNAGSVPPNPCPPPKKVVRNGGSNEPTVQLTGGATAEQASHERSSTDQLAAATEENLKKAEGLQLSHSQQEMVSQIKQFMDQSKAAVAGGDLERGHSLALKAHLLSDELVKP